MHIQNEYERRKGWRDAQGEMTYQAKGKSLMKRISDTTSECPAKRKRTPCSICKHTNHREANCFFRPGAPRCTYCKKPRHLKKDCWSKSGGKGKGRAKPRKETANVAVVDEGSSGIEEIHVTYDSRNNSKTPSSYLWHADSGASSHVTSDFKALHNYIPNIETIKGVGGIKIQLHGRGTIILQSKIKNQSFKITLNNVCYIPTQDGSLLSLSRLDKQGGGSSIHHGRVLILDEHLNTVAIGNAICNQYLMNVQTIYPENIHTTHEKLSWNQWHTRYGHISFSGLQKTHQMGLVNNFSVDTTTIPSDCSTCAKAKLTRTPHTNTSSIKTTSPGDLTHTDLCTTTDHGI
jgi:hypothetical protein